MSKSNKARLYRKFSKWLEAIGLAGIICVMFTNFSWFSLAVSCINLYLSLKLDKLANKVKEDL